jgi:hypothetical protein
MHNRTRAALLELAAALADDPTALLELSSYGDLPEHLVDAISDIEAHPEHFAA